MFCSSCGAQAHDGDLFCPECGKKLKHAAGGAASSGGSSSAYAANSPAGDPFAPTTAYSKSEKKPRKVNKGAAVIAVLLMLVVLAMLIFAGMRGYFGDLTGCFGDDSLPAAVDFVSGSDSSSGSSDFALPEDVEEADPTDADSTTASTAPTSSATATTMTTTTTTTTATTTTTKKPTTTTTVNAKKKEAEEIRKLLVSKIWTTEIEGYKATVKFKADGTATITVKVLFITQTIDAQYSVNDKCHAVILGEYGGNTYGISGTISKSSDTKLVVDRDNNMGKVTLTAA